MRTTAIIFTLILNWTFLIAQSTSIDSLTTDEKLTSQLKKQFTLTQYDHANIIMRFNRDTILIAGYLSDFTVGNSPKNVVYRTMNGGTTWELIKFKGDAWIYNTHFQNDGKVWMGGSDEYVHFSNDYGTTWIVKPKPFKPINRVLSIYMIDSLNGIAGGLNNGLAITNDNWKTTRQIPSPLDQKKFTISKNSARNRIDKIAILDSLILINQNDHIYYSKLNLIEWKEFNIPVSDFSIDKSNKQWSIFSIRNKVYVLSSRLDLIKTYEGTDEFFRSSESYNSPISLEDFFSSEIIKVKIKAVKYDFDKMSGGSMRYPVYKENIKEMKINDTESISLLKEILTTTNNYHKPLSRSFSFTEQDFASYDTFYSKTKMNRKEEKVWGGDFTSLLNIENEYFINPKQTVANLSQTLLDSVYKTFSFRTLLFEKNEPYIVLNLVNSKSDTLKVTSENSTLFSLPWTVEYNGQAFKTYDTRIIEYLRTLLPKDYNYYDKLFAGELIYRLIEQRTINELEYKNGY
ncbi:MAG: hypothetical protein Q8K70_08905 [Bacteroidota bacterium]|nr:hypothetical protein [Bacteroidota bacterium]